MAVTKQKKEEVVAELVDLFKNSKSVVFTDYQGISVKDVQDLRRQLRENDSQFKVAKKTLIKLAAKDAGFAEIPEEALVGQVGVAFSMGDEIAAARTLYNFSKSNEAVKLLNAFMEGRSLTQAETLELAKIPSKDELLAKMVGSMKSPITGFHAVLYSLLRSFASVVDAFRDSKPAEEAPKEEAKAEAPAEEKAAEAPKEEAPVEEAKTEEKAEEAPKEEEAKAPEEDTKTAEEPPKEELMTEEKAEAPTEEKTDEPAEEAPKKEEEAAPTEEQGEQSEASGESEANESEETKEEAPAEEEPPKEDPSPAASDQDNK